MTVGSSAADPQLLYPGEERYRTLVETIAVMVWSTPANGEIETGQPAWSAFTGQSFEELKGWGWLAAIHPDDRAATVQAWTRAVETATPYQVEHRVRRHDGHYRHLLARAHPVAGPDGGIREWAGLHIDIHDHKETAEMLRQAWTLAEHRAAELDAVIESMADAVYIGTEDGITKCNASALRQLGASSLEDLQLRIGELGAKFNVRYPDGRPVPPAELSFARALRGEVAVDDVVATNAETGEDVHIRGASAPVVLNGQVIGAVAVNADITDRVRVAEERLQLLESERAARGEAERANRLKVIERNARAQAQMISALLDMSRIISGKMRLDVQPVDLASVVDNAAEAVRHAAEAKEIRIVKTIDRRDGIIHGDPDRLQQVVWNLLSNAIRFTPSGGTVRVGLESKSSGVEIRVSDTGQGFDPAFAPFLFDRFRQADASTTRTAGGLGLGLAIVKQLVEIHGGTVKAESPGEGQGATFTILLPLGKEHEHGDDAGAAERPARPGDAPEAACESLRGVRILVVDDQDDARVLLDRVFVECGARVETAASAAEALEAVRRFRPDVLVSDLGMPGEDGYELIRKLRALPPDQGGNLPSAAVSALARPEDQRRALQAGYQVHIAKPVEPPELISAVAKLIGGGTIPYSKT